MSDFDTLAGSTTPPELVELYSLRDLKGNASYYNTGRDPITYNGQVYQPATIKRGVIKDDDSLSQRTVTITVPLNKILTDYLSQNSVRAEIAIYRLFPSAALAVVPIFFGTISDSVQIDVDTKTISARCVSQSSILEKEIPSLIYSAMCQNVLFDERCGLKQMLYTVAATITGISDNVLTSADFATKPADWFANGYAYFNGETRMITASQGNTITLLSPFNASLKYNDKIEAYAGCDGSPQTCATKFKNLRPSGACGFNGCPYIPTRNPVMWGFQ